MKIDHVAQSHRKRFYPLVHAASWLKGDAFRLACTGGTIGKRGWSTMEFTAAKAKGIVVTCEACRRAMAHG